MLPSKSQPDREESAMPLQRTITVRSELLIQEIDGSEFRILTVREETCGNPLFTSRVAHRLSEAAADANRVAIGKAWGDVDAAWRERA